MAHRGHRFHKEKTLQIKKFLPNIHNTSKRIHAHQEPFTRSVQLPYSVCETAFSQVAARKNRDILLLLFIAVASGGYKTDFNLNIIASLCLLFLLIFWWHLQGNFYRRNRRHRVAIMLFKLKSVLYPPDATAKNRRRKIYRFFLASAAYEHWVTIKQFGW